MSEFMVLFNEISGKVRENMAEERHIYNDFRAGVFFEKSSSLAFGSRSRVSI
jgi:hypothetical protein